MVAGLLAIVTVARVYADLTGLPTCVIVSAGAPRPSPLMVTAAGGGSLDLVVGRTKLPAIGSLRLSIWVAGGPLLAPLIREQTFEGIFLQDAEGITRCRFEMPIFQAKPGAMLKLAVSEVDDHRVVAEAWLQVAEPFDPTPLRSWVERHPVAIDPACVEIVAAFKQWGMPVQEPGIAAFAIGGTDLKPPTGVAIMLTIRQAKVGGVRIVIHQTSGEVTRIDASLPNLAAISTDPVASHEFLLVMHEVAKLLGDDSSFPNL